MATDLNKLNQQTGVYWRDIKHIDMSYIPDDVIASKIVRCILWHLTNNVSYVPVCNATLCYNKVSWHVPTGYGLFCSRKCAANAHSTKQKLIDTNMQKHGHSYAFQDNKTKDKIKQTNMAKYNGHHTQTIDVQNKRKATNLERYGVEHAMQNADVIATRKTNNIEKYGVDSYFKTNDFKQKRKCTMNMLYGVDHPLQNNIIQEKMYNTMTKLYGVKYALQSPKLSNKLSSTLVSRYNVTHAGHIYIPQATLDILNSVDKFVLYTRKYSAGGIAKLLGIDRNTVIRYCKIHNVATVKYTSTIETEMADFLSSLNISYKANTQTVIAPFELDFYLYKHNLAIEMNGDYWHSDKFKHKDYHYNKWKMCQDKNIQLISISESMWDNEQEKCKCIIMSLLNLKINTIGARKTQIRKITAKEVRPFVDKYHLQNFVGGSSHFGAFYCNNLVAVMTFGNTRNQRFELKRFVTDTNASYPGLFSKMFKYAQQELKFTEVVSFSDNRWFTGNVYEKTGFSYVKTLQPAYSYLYKGKLVHCSNFTKSNIKKKFPHMQLSIANGLTEYAAMTALQIPRVYDCGKKEWVWKIND